MLERAVRGTPMSKVEFLRMAPALVNRDGGIYDELPWKEWTVGDPFFSKRDCFERFIGRDYPGQSLKAENIKAGLADKWDELSESTQGAMGAAQKAVELGVGANTTAMNEQSEGGLGEELTQVGELQSWAKSPSNGTK